MQFRPRNIHLYRIVFFVVLAVGLTGVRGWAQSGIITTTIKFTKTVKVANTDIAPGDYKITATGGQVTFEDKATHKVVAQVPCSLKDLSYTAKGTTFTVDSNGRLAEIEVGGKKKAIEIP